MNGPNRKRGRQYDETFEHEVLDKLIYTSLEEEDSQEKAGDIAKHLLLT